MYAAMSYNPIKLKPSLAFKKQLKNNLKFTKFSLKNTEGF